MTQLMTEIAGPIAPHSTDVIDEPWDGPAEEAALSNDEGASTYRKMYAWVDPDKSPDTKTAYKFPHHKVTDGMPGPANVAGVRNALSRLPQAKIPEGDRAGVEKHLQRHLDDFDKTSKGAADAGSYPNVVRSLVERPWAILPETLVAIREVVAMRAQGERLSEDEVRERISGASYSARRGQTQTYPASDGQDGSQPMVVAVLPLYGVIVPKASLFSEVSGACSVEGFRRLFRDALGDRDVAAIVIDVDSPGGQTDLVAELAAEIRESRGPKPIVAVANTLTCSAAYWIACQADEIVGTPSAKVGSIGVFAAHDDISKLQEKIGVKTTLISAGKYKTEGNPFEPLSDSARKQIQERVDAAYDMFVADVAAGRGIDEGKVRNGYGEGRVLPAKAALAAGMIDRQETLEATVVRVARRVVSDGGGRPNALARTDGSAAANDGRSYAELAEAALVAVSALGTRTRSLAEYRERSRLTGSKREQLQAVVDETSALTQALEHTDPGKRNRAAGALTLDDEWELAEAGLLT